MSKKERIEAKVTDVLTTGFAEVMLLNENSETVEEFGRHIAIFNKEQKVHRGDIVEIIPFDPRTVKEAKLVYILPVIVFVFGILITGKLEWGERILSAAILAFMAFIVSWLMNRRARLLKRQEYKVVRIIKADPNHI